MPPAKAGRHHLEVLRVHPCHQVFLLVGQVQVLSIKISEVSPARHGVEGEPERLLDRHRRQVPVHL